MKTDRFFFFFFFGLLGGITLLFDSCIDVFQPELDGFQDVLVVDGSIGRPLADEYLRLGLYAITLKGVLSLVPGADLHHSVG